VRSPLSATSMGMNSPTSSESGEKDEDEEDGRNVNEFVSSLSKRVEARRALPESQLFSFPFFFFPFTYHSIQHVPGHTTIC